MSNYNNQNKQEQQQQISKQAQRNDYCQHFVNNNERPSNFIMNIKPEERFIDYPQLQELMRFKDQLINKRNHPTQFIKADLKQFDLTQLGKFDVILCDPPWREYEESVQDLPIYMAEPEKFRSWTLDEISSLPIDKISETPSFLFLWVGSEHLEDGRELFKRWGYKRCEDIVWAKTNKDNIGKFNFRPKNNDQILQRVKEHCLVGLRGDVKRASDSHFIHANIDTDVIVDEEPPIGSLKKPQELYSIIERFCLGRKRLELFGELHNIRDGWLTIGQLLPSTNFNLQGYNQYFEEDQQLLQAIQQQNMNNPRQQKYPNYPTYQGGRYLGTTAEIEARRPKSPPKNNMGNMQNNSQTRSQMFQQQQKQHYQKQQQQQQQYQQMKQQQQQGNNNLQQNNFLSTSTANINNNSSNNNNQQQQQQYRGNNGQQLPIPPQNSNGNFKH